MEKEQAVFSQRSEHPMPVENFTRLINQLQEKIDTTIREVGGYWTPLSAFARVSEEFGEISDILLTEPFDHDAFGRELADLFIITTCLANQYCVKLDEEYKQLGFNSPQTRPSSIHSLQQSELIPSFARQIGAIARIVNYYEGQKKKKPSDENRSLREEIPKLHLLLFAAAELSHIDLPAKTISMLDQSKERDRNRFDISQDPITEESLRHFKHVVDTTFCPFARKAKLWGAASWEK